MVLIALEIFRSSCNPGAFYVMLTLEIQVENSVNFWEREVLCHAFHDAKEKGYADTDHNPC